MPEKQEHNGRIGNMNGWYARLFKTALIAFPIISVTALPWAVWVTDQIIITREFRSNGSRFTQQDAAMLKETLIEKINAIAPLTPEWKDKINSIERLSQDANSRLIRIETLLQKEHR